MSTNQILFIHKFQSLFCILDEIKSNLNFNIEHFDKNQIDKTLNEVNFVVISSEKKIKFENQLKINVYPITIQKLIEIINIQFLKNKFNQQNNVKAGKYYVNLNSRVMNFGDNSLQLTEKEMKIIKFLTNSNVPITIERLQSEVWGYKSKLETHTVETHVYRLRKKVERKFQDKSFIISFKDGYKIQT